MSASRSQGGVGATASSSRSSAPTPATTAADDDPVLLAAKSALFAKPSRAAATAADRPETEEEESARIAADSAASLAALDAELNGVDGVDSQLDLTTRGGGGAGGSGEGALDFLDFSAVDSDFARFQQNELVKEAVEKGRDLRAYAEEVETQLALHERRCVEDYLTDADDLSSLHTQLRSCDSILATMESMLSHFQSDLSAISSEIESLQDKSYSMNIKLRNYKIGERSLNSYIQNIYIPDDLCNCILEAEIGEPYVLALKELDKKLRFLNTEAKSMAQHGGTSSSHPTYSQAAKDMIPIGEKLKAKSVARIRAFLLERFHQLRKPKTNIQIKQKSLLKFAALYQFLLAHADSTMAGQHATATGHAAVSAHDRSHSNLHAPSTPGSSSSAGAESGSDICAEIRTEYQKTMSAIYRSKFGKYLSEMRKLQADSAIKESDTLASEGSTKGAAGTGGATPSGSSSGGGGMGSMLSGLFSSKRSAADIDHIFRLNGRDDVLATPVSSAAQGTVVDGSSDGDLIIPHLASASGGKLPFAKLFKSAQSLLMDTATSEYDFIVEFFGERMQRDMDRAGVHEDALAAEKEADALAESEANIKPTPAAASAAAADHAAAASTPAKPAGPSYALSPSDERGREHLSPHSRDKHLFALVFGDTFKLFQEHLSDFLSTSHDALGTLVLIRIVCQHNIAMQYRRVHCLDHVFDRENMMLWPKFKQTFDAHVDSVMKCPPFDAKTAKSGSSGAASVTRPHYIGSRYADFAAGLLTLNAGYNDEILIANLRRLRGEVDKFLLRSASRIAGTPALPAPKAQIIFLLSNYHSILFRLRSAGFHDSDDAIYWSTQSKLQVDLYVEEELCDKFAALVRFVKANPLSVNPVELKRFVDEAAGRTAYWKEGIENINASVARNFAAATASAAAVAGEEAKKPAATMAAPGSRTSQGLGGPSVAAAAAGASSAQPAFHLDIFMEVLSQLILYHRRFQSLVEKHLERKDAQKLVSNQEIMIEIKKISKH